MRDVHVITDLQFGSTGKGLFAGYLAKRVRPDTLVCAFGPNAGHTFVDSHGEKYVNIMLPSGVVSSSVKRVLIGPGAVIDPARMLDELTRYALFDNAHVQVAIHENAAVVSGVHREAEQLYGFKIGSTMKGAGEALISKIRRGDGLSVAGSCLRNTPLEPFLVGVADYNDLLDRAEVVQVEGSQGFSLSINQGFYPYVTSRDCTCAQILSDCAIPIRPTPQGTNFTVYGVARTYPIRVANRFKDGEQIGTSGPCYHDQMEILWNQVGVAPELTTVTRLPRRIFTFSEEQIRQAVRMNGVDYVFLNFCNYVKDPLELAGMMAKIEAAGAIVRWTGWGEREDQIQRVKRGE